MTTAQEPLNGHRPSPPPCSIENPSEANRADLPTNRVNPIPNPSYVSIDTSPLPDRCQFTFSDGRQCTMARSDIHPSLCRFHSEREEQLFGEPFASGIVRGAKLDLPELYSACRDLTTAAGVNRALAQVFRLLAQRRISRQEAATFGHLAQLLLRSISAMRAESIAAMDDRAPAEATNSVILSEQRERRTSPELAPERIISPSSSPLREPASQHHKDGASGHQPTPCELPTPQPAPPPAATDQPLSAPSPDAPNSRKINTSEFAALNPVHNQHLQNNRGPFAARKSCRSDQDRRPERTT